MRPLGTAALCLAFAILTFFQFPGHTWLQQDTQIYVPILEHLRNPAVLRNDLVVAQPHVSFTLYDEVALGLRAVTGLGFREVLAIQQIATRALGFWGLMLLAEALGLSWSGALAVAAICSLGAVIAGPTVLTVEYEPTPRAFAVPLIVCAMGLAAKGRHLASGIAGAAALLYHPPTALVFWVAYVLVISEPRPSGSARSAALLPLAAALLILFVAARVQGETQSFLGTISPAQETLQRMRVSYVWVSTWPWSVIAHHLLVFAILLGAYVQLRQHLNFPLRVFLLGLPAIGLLSMPLSWLLLERWKWALIPQIQPMRYLLFGTLAMQLLAAAAGVRAGRSLAAAAWFTAAFLPPLQPSLTGPFEWGRIALAAGLGATAAFGLAPAAAIAAFLLVPWVGGVKNYPSVMTPQVAELSAWARAQTPADAVFHFADARRGLDPGIFRATALRAVYVDWKGGGQVNYLPEFGARWWPRWQAMQSRRYEGLDIQYVVLQKAHRLPRPPLYENTAFVVYTP